MTISQVAITLIDPNPFQTRKSYDPEILEGLKKTAQNSLGIRFMPIVRPHPEANGRYQIASGHSRVEAWKQLGHKKIQCRVELLDDKQMAREMLVENLHRQKMSDEEIFEALENVRGMYGLEMKGSSPPAKDLHNIIKIPEYEISRLYDVFYKMKPLLDKKQLQLKDKSTVFATRGLNDDERVALVGKATEEGWTTDRTYKVKQALQEMEPETRKIILDTPGDLNLEVKRVDERQRLLDELDNIHWRLQAWGIHQKEMLGNKWKDAVRLLDLIEAEARRAKEV